MRGCSSGSGIDARFSFDFGEWTSPLGASFGALRVLNEDRIGGGRGFATHGHSDYEIFSLVLAGTVRHVDSITGRATRCSRGEVQYTCAGTGIEHSEHNDDGGDGGGSGSDGGDGTEGREVLHLLQVWLRPHTLRLPPRYEVRASRDWAAGDTGGALRLLLSVDGARGSIIRSQRARRRLATTAAAATTTTTTCGRGRRHRTSTGTGGRMAARGGALGVRALDRRQRTGVAGGSSRGRRAGGCHSGNGRCGGSRSLRRRQGRQRQRWRRRWWHQRCSCGCGRGAHAENSAGGGCAARRN